MSNTDSKYGELVNPLTERFGVPFEFWYTGGGCTAIEAFMDGDITVIVEYTV